MSDIVENGAAKAEEAKKRVEDDDIKRLTTVKQLPKRAAEPILQHDAGEGMSSFYRRLQPEIDSKLFQRVDTIDSDGLYITKRAIIGAEGYAELLNQAGTVFYHTSIFLRRNGKTTALDYGPQGNRDVTANVLDEVKCAPILHDDAEPDPKYPLLKIKVEHGSLSDTLVTRAIRYAENRKYHAITNNCIKNTDFLCRVLTFGKVVNAPMVYDALVGEIPQEDHPMLGMFLLMTQMSWFDVCDGSKIASAFMMLQAGNSKAELKNHPSFSKKPLHSAGRDERLSETKIDMESILKSLDNATRSHKAELRN